MNINDNGIYKSIESFISRFEGIVNFFAENEIYPEFSDAISTACVTFDSKYTVKCSKFLINEKFWNALNYNERVLVFIHETLHILFKHNKRVHEYFDSILPAKRSNEIMQIATDISINHIIIEKYLNNIPLVALPTLKNMACLIETVFKPEDSPSIPRHMSFIYYYEKYIELYGMKKPKNNNFDEHPEINKESISENDDFEQQDIDKILDGMLKELGLEIDENEQVIFQTKMFGTNNVINEEKQEIIVNKAKSLEDHFKLVIKTVSAKKEKEKPSYNWYGFNRRTSIAMQSISPTLNVPVKAQKKKEDENEYNICAYLDVSGSCESYSIKFMELTSNLPDNYNLDIYVFADRVRKVEVDCRNGKKTFNYKGAGCGTNILNVLQNHKEIEPTKKYDAVFVLTDGEYQNIKSNTLFDYTKWFFFMSPNYRNNVPEKAKLFEMKHL
jgi:predicted metallopeptidase